MGRNALPWSLSRGFLSATLALVTLPGCPVSDDYYVENSPAATAGSSGSSAGDGGKGGAGSATGECAPACNAGRACIRGRCEGGWLSMAQPPAEFSAREKSAYVVFGDKLFIFSGVGSGGESLNRAAIYDPGSNSWTLARRDGSPSSRELASVAWGGERLLVFGGRDSAGTALSDGAVYDPSADLWAPMASGLGARVGAVAGAYGTKAVFWAGWTGALASLGGAERFDVALNRWEPASNGATPGKLEGAASAFAGQSLYVAGGHVPGGPDSNSGHRYDLSENAWAPLPPAPSPRSGAFGVADAERFYVWGGRTGVTTLRDGYIYSGAWTAMSTRGAPAARRAAYLEAGWAYAIGSDDLVVIGGLSPTDDYLHDGGRYQAATGVWTPIPAWPSGEDHAWGIVAWVAGELIVFAGSTNGQPTRTGERWAPSSP